MLFLRLSMHDLVCFVTLDRDLLIYRAFKIIYVGLFAFSIFIYLFGFHSLGSSSNFYYVFILLTFDKICCCCSASSGSWCEKLEDCVQSFLSSRRMHGIQIFLSPLFSEYSEIFVVLHLFSHSLSLKHIKKFSNPHLEAHHLLPKCLIILWLCINGHL